MIKNSMVAAGILVAAVFAPVSGVSAQIGIGLGEPLYSYTYFSDATHTVVVGWAWGVCYPGYVGTGPLQGQASRYVLQERVGRCINGETIYE